MHCDTILRVGHFIGNIDTYLSYKFKGMQDNDLEKKFKTYTYILFTRRCL